MCTPLPESNTITAECPARFASKRGVEPSLSTGDGLTPWLMSLSTVSGRPSETARCNDVRPSMLARFKSMPSISMASNFNKLPLAAARHNLCAAKLPDYVAPFFLSQVATLVRLWVTACSRGVCPQRSRTSK